MRIIVVGAGKVGFEIAKRLSDEDHDVIVIDKNEAALTEVTSHLDVMTLAGNGANPMILEEAGISESDIVIAVTEIDEVNMIASMAAKQYGVKTCVARIRNPEYTPENPHAISHHRLGIDLIIDPERLAALEITRLLRFPMATDMEFFASGMVSLLGMQLGPEATIINKPLSQCDLPNCLIAAISRENDVIIPNGESVLLPSDRIFVVGRTGNFQRLQSNLGRTDRPLRKVMVMGGGKIGRHLATILSGYKRRSFSVTLMEKDPAKADALARQFPNILVVNGDGTKIDVLKEEGIQETDALVAVSGEDHTNLLAAMLAKEMGVREVIVEISREDYTPLAKRSGADAIVVPRLLTVSSVLRLVRRSDILALAILEGGKAEAFELVAVDGARIVGKSLKDVSFPRDAIVGAHIRRDRVTIPRGDTVIETGDRVIVFALPEAIPDVENLFQPQAKSRRAL